jgi:acyl-CoA reductase-like NAD-dependent aldehyde dehydrogenase
VIRTSGPSGTLPIPEGDHTIPATPFEQLDEAVETVRAQAPAWSKLDPAARIELIDELIEGTLAAAPAWTRRAAEAKGIPRDSRHMGEDWISGPGPVLRLLQLLKGTMQDIVDTGRPQPPSLDLAPNGQVVAKVFPTEPLDNLIFTGFTAEIRLQRHVTLDQATERIGRVYRPGGKPDPSVALVLGAGNVSCIGLMDVLTALFVEDHVCVLKMNPVNEHLGPYFAEAFEALVRQGFLRIVYGGAREGAYLVEHDGIDKIHITGSDKTYQAIVFGTGEEGERRRRANDPKMTKPISAELGNVSPVIVVPGPWSDGDIAFHGHNIASMLVQNAGFNCLAARAIVTHRSWTRRRDLLNAIRDSLRTAEERVPYYPGAVDRWRRFTEAHKGAEWFGQDGVDRVPFTLIPDLDADDVDAVAFTTEAFCAVVGEVGLDAPRSVAEYIEQAVEFCNETCWGSLSASIIVHPKSLKDPAVADAVERAIDDLRYGSVVVNHWSAVAYGMGSTSWGAYPGHTPDDIQSGTGVVHNTYLLEDVEKSVVRGPFRVPLTPVWFHTHRELAALGPAFTACSATRDPRLLPRVLWAAARG